MQSDATQPLVANVKSTNAPELRRNVFPVRKGILRENKEACMAVFYGTFIIEWECLKPEVHKEEHGTLEWTGSSIHDVSEQFLQRNPDYRIINVQQKINVL